MLKSRIESKKGWIRIVEVFSAILIIAGVVLIAIQQSQGAKDETQVRIHNDQIGILRDIQLDNSLRAEIIGTSGTVEWNNFSTLTKTRIIEKTPSYLECQAKICNPSDLCLLTGADSKSIYAESIIISATINTYNPRQLKLFCWEKA